MMRFLLPFAFAVATVTAEQGLVGPPQGSLVPEWHVEVVQHDSVLLCDNGAVCLLPEPFVLRVSLPEPLYVKLNATDENVNFREFADSVPVFGHCFDPFRSMAEGFFNENEGLTLDAEAHHCLYYNGPADHRWSTAKVTPEQTVFERRVRRLFKDHKRFPLKHFDGRSIYLIFLVRFPKDGDRFKKVIINFEDASRLQE